MFGVSRTTVCNIFLTLLYALHTLLFKTAMRSLPSPDYTRTLSPNTPCTQIWDCTDVFIPTPRCDIKQQRVTYSHYRGGHTLKALVVVGPTGTILYVSDLFSGGASDKEIVIQSGIISRLQPGHIIFADKGFLISDLLPPGVAIQIPSFLDCKTRQLTPDQITRSKKISSVRIHVERAIGRIKNFTILRDVPHKYRSHLSIIFQTCAALVNFQNPLVQTREDADIMPTEE